MKVYLLADSKLIVNIWNLYFKGISDVMPICDDFRSFIDHSDVDCVVSPANSYGLMDGGYDLAISEWFGWELQDKVQEYILRNYRGEQPVGTSFIIETEKRGIKLIHTPTMRIPHKICDPMVVYHCMRSCIITAINNDIKSIVIPPFGGGCGMLRAQTLCYMMYEAYCQVMNPPKKLDWDYAFRVIPENTDWS